MIDKLCPTASTKRLVMFFIAAFIIFILFFTSLTILPLYVIEVGGTEFDTGIQSTLFFLTAILLRIYFGPLTDRKGRKIPLLIGAFVFASSTLIFIFTQSVWSLTLARVYQAIGLATFLASGSSFVADMAPVNMRGTYMGVYRLIITLSLLVGPSVAMEIINRYGYNIWYFSGFIAGVFALGLIALIKETSAPDRVYYSTLESMAAVLKEKNLWPVYAGFALMSVAYGAVMTFVSIYISKYTEIANPALYFTYYGLAGLLANLLAGYLSDRIGRTTVVWPCAMLLGLGVMLLLFIPVMPGMIIISAFAAGIGMSGGMSALYAWVVDEAREMVRATALSIQESIIDMFFALGTFIFGILSGLFSLSASFGLIGFFEFLFAMMLLVYTRKRQGIQVMAKD
ncbi:MAG: MFS transporter [Bacillota bacterium]